MAAGCTPRQMDELLAHAKTGDIVLVSRSWITCNSILKAITCAATQELLNSNWNHVGVVVVDESGVAWLLEAGLEANKMRCLVDVLESYSNDERFGQRDGYLFGCYPGSQVAIRKLDFPVGQGRPEMLTFAKQLEATPSAQSTFSQWRSVFR